MAFPVLAAAIPAVAGIIGHVIQQQGQMGTNESNKRMNDDSNAWSANMSNTSYVRGMRDMKAAGLNPMLAYKQGGANVPNPSVAKFENPQGDTSRAAEGAAASSMQAARLKADLDKMVNENANLVASTRVAETQQSLNTANAFKAASDAKLNNTQNELIRNKIPKSEIDKKLAPVDAVLDRIAPFNPMGTGKRIFDKFNDRGRIKRSQDLKDVISD